MAVAGGGGVAGEANALDDDIDLAHVFTGHGDDLFAHGDLNFVGGTADFGTVGDDEADLDTVGVIFLADFDAAMIGLPFGKDLGDAVNNAATDGGDAGNLEGRRGARCRRSRYG